MVELEEILSLRVLDPGSIFVESLALVINPKVASKVLASLSTLVPLQR